MATRRSRIQFRPNIGPKVGKSTPASGSQPVPSNSKENDSKIIPSVELKPDEQVEADKTSVDVPASDLQSVPIADANIGENQVTTDVKIPNDDTISSEKTIEVETQANTEKVNSEKPKENVITKEEATVAKPETKPKYRSRFPKARPNLADSGRPKISRPSTSQNVPTPPVPVAVIKSPVSKSISPLEQVNIQESVNTPQPESQNIQEKPVPLSPVKQSTTKNVDPPPPSPKLETPVNIDNKRKSTEAITEVSIKRKRSGSMEKKPDAAPEKRKEHQSHRRLPSTFEPPNRQKLTMGDLIYWNPSKNVLKPKAKRKSVANSPKKESKPPAPVPAAKEVVVLDPENENDDDDLLPVPQVKIGPDGNIILNEESLVIDNQEKDTTQEMEIVEEDESRPCCGFYGNRIQSKRWNVMETKQFYRALATVGTDFTMLMKLFPGRSRREIKNKFKKEERFHRVLIDKAIDQRQKFSLAILEKFEEERKDYLDFLKSEQIRVKQQKIAARLEKRKLREEKRKQRILLEKKENQIRRSQRKKKKRRKTMYDDESDEVNEVLADRGVEVTDELHSKREEVVEILVNMSYGCPSRPEHVDSSEDGEKEWPEVIPFIPKKLKPAVVDDVVTDVEEDSTVDMKVFTPSNDSAPVEALSLPSVSVNKVDNHAEGLGLPAVSVNNAVTNVDNPPQGLDLQSVSVNDVDSTVQTPRHAPPVVQVEQLLVDQVELVGSPSDADRRLHDQMADKKVQMVLVPEESAGQTVFHVYIVPDGAESIVVDGRTVMLSPTHTPCHGMMSPRHNAGPETKSSQPQTSNSLLPYAPIGISLATNEDIANSGKQGSSVDALPEVGHRDLNRTGAHSLLHRDLNRTGAHSLLHHNPPSGTSFEIGSTSISALQPRSVKTKSVCHKPSILCKSPQRTTKPCQTQAMPTLKISAGQKSFTPLPSPSKFHTSNPDAEATKSSPVLEISLSSSRSIVKKEALFCDPPNKAVLPYQTLSDYKTDSSEPSVGYFVGEEGLLSSNTVGCVVTSQEHEVFTSMKSEGDMQVDTVACVKNDLEYDSGIMCEPPPRTVVVDGTGQIDECS